MIRGYLFGDRETVARFTQLRGKAKDAAKTTVQRLTLRLMRRVKEDKLSGQVLKVRTGRLRRSINQRIEETSNSVTGIVGTNVEYAGRHEFGFSGAEQVRAHLRRIRGRSVYVRGHTREVNYPARSFLRSALDDMKGEVQDEFRKALRTAMR